MEAEACINTSRYFLFLVYSLMMLRFLLLLQVDVDPG
jgi:hypothetical protein